MSIVKLKRAKVVQDAKLSGITVKDIARALATMAGGKAVSDFDAVLIGNRSGKEGEGDQSAIMLRSTEMQPPA